MVRDPGPRAVAAAGPPQSASIPKVLFRADKGGEAFLVKDTYPGFADDFPFCEIAAELTDA